MQVRPSLKFVATSALSVVAALWMAMSNASAQEIDRSETLQARNLASQVAQQPGRSRAAVVAETRNLQAAGQLKGVGELSGAPVVTPAPEGHAMTRAEVKADLAQWRASHRLVVGDLG